MNPSVSIRLMTAGDLDRVIEIERRLSHAPHWPHAAYISALDPHSHPRRIALVTTLVATTEPAGFAVASLLPPQAELELIAVAPEFQRIGLARLLFSALAKDLKSRQVTEVILEVRASNGPGLALYRSLGFVETARRIRYYADPVEDAVLLSLLIK